MENNINFKFDINGAVWQIKEISREEMDYDKGRSGYYTHGYTCYSENVIYINKTSSERIRTLIHELTHCWLYMYGHNQEDKKFTNEDVCEIVASMYNFISDVCKKYSERIKKYG